MCYQKNHLKMKLPNKFVLLEQSFRLLKVVKWIAFNHLEAFSVLKNNIELKEMVKKCSDIRDNFYRKLEWN